MFTSITDFPICDDKKHLKTLQNPSELRNTALEVTIFIITLFVFSVLYAIQAYKNTYFHFLPYPTQGSKLYPLSNILTFFFFLLNALFTCILSLEIYGIFSLSVYGDSPHCLLTDV